MTRKTLIFIFLLYFTSSKAQNLFWCDSIYPLVNQIEEKTNSITISDPELITLHYLFVIDIENDLQYLYKQKITKLNECKTIDHNKIINQYDRIRDQIRFLKDTLFILKSYVDQMFYDHAFLELQLKNYSNALYNINRSLEYKPFAVNPLLLKLDILYEKKEYEKCLEVLNILYHEVPLNEIQEKRTIDFNMKFYNTLYTEGDSLIKLDKAIDAFEIFTLLETFCNNMPIGYCNDDYYHGILRTKVGVYESYLKIASVAKERGNREMENKFLEYAKEYLDTNSELLEEIKFQEQIQLTSQEDPKPKTQDPKPKTQDPKPKTQDPKPKTQDPININRENTIDSTIIQYKQYQELVNEAIDLCIQKEFDQAYDKFVIALEMESCNCFLKDARVTIFLTELRKIRSDG